MRFYRPLGQIAALTFDLDDTLYDNHPVIRRTEQESLACARNYHPALRTFSGRDFEQLRLALHQAEPEIYHDVTEWRRRTLVQAMLNAGLTLVQAGAGASVAMDRFAKWRSRIDVPREVCETLKNWRKNGHWQPLPTAMPGQSRLVWITTSGLCCVPARMDAPSHTAICITLRLDA